MQLLVWRMWKMLIIQPGMKKHIRTQHQMHFLHIRLLAQTSLRNILGTKNLHEILSDRDSISMAMQVGIILRLKSFSGTIPANNSIFARTLPANNPFFAGTLLANNSILPGHLKKLHILFVGTLPPNNFLFAGMVPSNKKLFARKGSGKKHLQYFKEFLFSKASKFLKIVFYKAKIKYVSFGDLDKESTFNGNCASLEDSRFEW